METKTCFRCKITKSTTDFYWKQKKKDGPYRVGTPCKACVKIRKKAYAKTPDGRRKRTLSKAKQLRKKYKKDPVYRDKVIARLRAARLRDPLKHRARKKLYRAVKAGRIQRLPCVECKDPSVKADGHHNDYTKPLEVVWMCRSCHMRLHQGDLNDTSMLNSIQSPSPPPAPSST